MAEFLVIRIGKNADQPAQWIVVDDSGACCNSPVIGHLNDAVIDIDDRTVIVLVPGAEVLTTSVDIPIKGRSRFIAALPYALENELAEDIDRLHFSIGIRRSNGRIPVAVVNRERLDQWIECLTEVGIQPTFIIPDNHGLARIPDTISMLVAEDQVMINDGADIELVMQRIRPSEALAAIGVIDETESNQAAPLTMLRNVLIYCEAKNDEQYQDDWLLLRNKIENVTVNLLKDSVLSQLALTVATGTGINLLQGNFRAKSESSRLFRPWRYVAMLLFALGLVGIATKTTNYYLLKQQETNLKQQFEVEYRQIVPNASSVNDPTGIVGSLKARAGASVTPSVFLQSLEQLSQAIKQNKEARIDAISYRVGVVNILLTAPNISTLDSIQRVISESDRFKASIQSTDQDGDKVSSRIQIQVNGI
jgi:general secretion pathway protein L